MLQRFITPELHDGQQAEIDIWQTLTLTLTLTNPN